MKKNYSHIPPPSLPSSHYRYASLPFTTPAANNGKPLQATAATVSESKSTENPKPRSSNNSSRTNSWWYPFILAMVLLALSPLYCILILKSTILAPEFSSFSVSSAFANVSAWPAGFDGQGHVRGVNLDLNLQIKNNEDNGMVYSHMKAYALHDKCKREKEGGGEEEEVFRVFDGVTLQPFEQIGQEDTTVRLSLENITMPLDDGVYSVLQFGLSGKLRYKGMTLSKNEISMQVYCDHVKIPFSYNNASEKVGFKVHQCEVSGFIWDFIKVVPMLPLVFFIASLLALSCKFCEQNLKY